MPDSRPRRRAPFLAVLLLSAPAVALALSAAPPAVRLTAFAPTALAPDPWGGWLRWPLAGTPVVVRAFAPPPQPQPWLPGHRGVDLAAEAGDGVRAAGPGVVVFAGDLAGRGVVSIAHPGGLRTTYEPVSPLVAVGDEVSAGTVIGEVVAGHVGCPVAACLHWGARHGDVYLDPVTLVGPPRLRLKPLA